MKSTFNLFRMGIASLLFFYAASATATDFVYWHENNEVYAERASDRFYETLGNDYAKILTDGNRVIRKFYDPAYAWAFQMVLGSALQDGALQACRGAADDLDYFVYYHVQNRCELAAKTSNGRDAINAFDAVSPRYAKVLIVDGVIIDTYGSELARAQCVGEYLLDYVDACL